MTHLKVAVRVRPLSKRERENGSENIVVIENKNISITNDKVPEQNAGDSRERIRRFTFDYCFHQNSSQDDLFNTIEKVVGNAIKRRHHSCVLAYGQSSTGKTHTMMGFPHDPGLTPRLCERIFYYIKESAVGEELEHLKTTVSYLEIYNEKVRDLLCNDTGNNKTVRTLKVREHPQKGPYVQDLTEHPVQTPEELLSWVQVGNSARRVAATLSNPQSSRSHSVITISFGGVRLYLVDLAGSERAGQRLYPTCRFREGANINRSLVALGNVISALAERTIRIKGVRRRFVPYRDSVLTWLLKEALGGNSSTVMIATVSPSSTCYSETVNTLRFGQRAKLIVSCPVVNEDPKEKTIRELRAEIAKLRELLKFNQNLTSPFCHPSAQEIFNEDYQKSFAFIKEDPKFEKAALISEPLQNNKYELCETKTNQNLSDSLSSTDLEDSLEDRSCLVEDYSNSSDDFGGFEDCKSDNQSLNEEKVCTQDKLLEPVDFIKHEIINAVIEEEGSEAEQSENVTWTKEILQKENKSHKPLQDDNKYKEFYLLDLSNHEDINKELKEEVNLFIENEEKDCNYPVLSPSDSLKSLSTIPEFEEDPLEFFNSQNMNRSKLSRTFSIDTEKPPSKPPSLSSPEASTSQTPPNIKSPPSGVSSFASNLFNRRKSSTSSDKGSLSKSLLAKKQFDDAAAAAAKKFDPIIDKSKVAAKVDSMRKPGSAPLTSKPRSQIVAAVTHRLYFKAKKKEVGTDTDDLRQHVNEPPKENICSNARSRLKELTHRAMRAHRFKNIETQTITPVLLLKEKGTDSNDLKLEVQEVKNATTSTLPAETCDASNDCVFLETLDESNNLNNGFHSTRSCGTQSCDNIEECHVCNSEKPLLSFKKYLQDKVRFKCDNPATANPIYTNSVNINISHNYMHRSRAESVSDDSLEYQNQNVGLFPTPDLISNHNSLEPHAQDAEVRMRLPNTCELAQRFTSCDTFNVVEQPKFVVANCINLSPCVENATSTSKPCAYAPEICVTNLHLSKRCLPLKKHKYDLARGHIVESKDGVYNDCVIVVQEPVVMQSTISFLKTGNPQELPPEPLGEVQDTKKEIFSTMNRFLEEATQLMNSITKAVGKLETSRLQPEADFDLEVSISDVRGLESGLRPIRRPKRKTKLEESTSQTEYLPMAHKFAQTAPKSYRNSYTQFEDLKKWSFNNQGCCCEANNYVKPSNNDRKHNFKQDELIKSTTSDASNCSTEYLELASKKRSYTPSSEISHSSTEYLEVMPNRNQVIRPSPVTYQRIKEEPLTSLSWDLDSNYYEGSSMESNVNAYSDYGSLPRRRSLPRQKAGSPSEYLRQLTNMRKELVRSSRDSLFKNY